MNKVLSILSTYQTPHFEDLLNMETILNDGRKVEILDIAKNAPLRVDLPMDDTLRISISKIFHNVIKKSLAKLYIRFKQKIIINTFVPNGNLLDRQSILGWDDLLNAYLSYWYVKKNTVGIEVEPDNLCKFYELSIYAINVVKLITQKYSLDDTIIIFNGRLPLEYFLHQELKKAGFKNIQFLELSQYNQRILLRKDSPHELKSFTNEITQFVQAKTREFIEDEFQKLTNSLRADYTSVYSNNQNQIVIFTSSLDEFFFKFEDVPNIYEIISVLIKTIKLAGYKVVVRVHPITHMKSLENKIFWLILKYKFPEHMILWNEPADSFDIINKSTGVITFGSSLSAYAAAVGKPVLILGDNTLYSNLCAVDNITFEELFSYSISKPNYFINVFEEKENSLDIDRLEAKSAFIFERYLGFDRDHRLFAKNIARDVTIFQANQDTPQLPVKRVKYFDEFLRIFQLVVAQIRESEPLISQNLNRYFFMELTEKGELRMQFTSELECGEVPFDSCRNCIEHLRDIHGDVLDFRTVPLEFFSVKSKDFLTLAYVLWSYPKLYYKKAAFCEAFYFWKKKYQIELERL